MMILKQITCLVYVGSLLILTRCDPLDCSPPGSSVHGILQARILEGMPFPSPGNLPNPGIEPASTFVSFTGKQVLHHLHHL